MAYADKAKGAATRRRWARKNRDKMREYLRRFNERHPERRQEYRARYEAKHPRRVRLSKLAYKIRNRAKVRAARIVWRRRNYTQRLIAEKAYRVRNSAACQERIRRWMRRNRERYRQIKADWLRENPGYESAACAKRRARLLERTPLWADLQKIQRFYARAMLKTKRTGIPHCVDHVIPLRGKRVSGLHVETNLRVITKRRNDSKSNRFIPRSIPPRSTASQGSRMSC